MFCHIKIVESKRETYQYWLCCDWLDVMCNYSNEGGCLKNAQNKHHIQVNTVIKSFFAESTEKELHETIDTFWSRYKNSIIRMILLTVINLSVTVKIFVMVIVICGIRNNLFHPPSSVFYSLQGNFKNTWNRICRAFMGWC